MYRMRGQGSLSRQPSAAKAYWAAEPQPHRSMSGQTTLAQAQRPPETIRATTAGGSGAGSQQADRVVGPLEGGGRHVPGPLGT